MQAIKANLLSTKNSLAIAFIKAKKSPQMMQRFVNFYLAYIECFEISKSKRESHRLLKVINTFPCGVKKAELLAAFYEGYLTASPGRRESLRLCLEKLIQRARKTHEDYGLNIYYCKKTCCYFVIVESAGLI